MPADFVRITDVAKSDGFYHHRRAGEPREIWARPERSGSFNLGWVAYVMCRGRAFMRLDDHPSMEDAVAAGREWIDNNPLPERPASEKLFRVYRYYVGCHVYDVSAETAQQAQQKVETFGDSSEHNVEFLHEANEPSENHFFTEVFEYDEDVQTPDDATFVFNSACAKIWRELPADQNEETGS